MLNLIDCLDELVLVVLKAGGLLILHHSGFDSLEVAIKAAQKGSLFPLGCSQLINFLAEGGVASQLLLYFVLRVMELLLHRCQRVFLSIATLLLQIFDVKFQIQTLHINKLTKWDLPWLASRRCRFQGLTALSW